MTVARSSDLTPYSFEWANAIAREKREAGEARRRARTTARSIAGAVDANGKPRIVPGQRIGALTVQGRRLGAAGRRGDRRHLCECQCGEFVIARQSRLLSGAVTACGEKCEFWTAPQVAGGEGR